MDPLADAGPHWKGYEALKYLFVLYERSLLAYDPAITLSNHAAERLSVTLATIRAALIRVGKNHSVCRSPVERMRERVSPIGSGT